MSALKNCCFNYSDDCDGDDDDVINCLHSIIATSTTLTFLAPSSQKRSPKNLKHGHNICVCFLLVFFVFVIVKMYKDSQGTYISACSPVCLWQAGIYCSGHFSYSWLHISDLLCSPFPLLYCWDIDNPFQRLGDPYLLLRRGIYSMSE